MVKPTDPQQAPQGQQQKPAAAEQNGGIDWANVASEVNTMLDLNKAANEAWGAGAGWEEETEQPEG